jgi:CBS domain-containing protein
MLLQDLFRNEDDLITAHAEETLGVIAARMEDKNVGAIVIVDEDRKVLGIATDRDLALNLGMNQATADTPVSQIMTKNVITIWEDQGVFNATQYFSGKKKRRLPVIDRHDRLVGMVTFDDLVAVLSRELFHAAQSLEPAIAREGVAGSASFRLF